MELWPHIPYNKDDEPKFLFMLTPPNSGSTAMAQIATTASNIELLHSKGEGQQLIPGMFEIDRWSPEKYIDYESVKSVWLAKYQSLKKQNPLVNTIFEKSPPNQVRIYNIIKMFKDTSLLINIRNPYANCASRLYRYYNYADQRSKSLHELANNWVRESTNLKQIAHDTSSQIITYEQFCNNPNILSTFLSTDVDISVKIKIKDYEPSLVTNYNDKQISKLTAEDISIISSVIRHHSELVEFYGYEVL